MNRVVASLGPAAAPVTAAGSIRPAAVICVRPMLVGLLGMLAGCMELPVQTYSEPATNTAAAEVAAATQVFVYPSRGQSAQQLDRDRYECYLWAVEQTRFDPNQVELAPHQRTHVVAMPPAGSETAASAIAGAAIGAVIARPGHAAEGAITGAVIGGLAGAASEEAARADRAEALRALSEERESAQLERQSNEYRRALSACLEGRGYTVK